LPKFPNILKIKRKIIPNNPGRDGGSKGKGPQDVGEGQRKIERKEVFLIGIEKA
jgi:hypothetical protein